MGKFSHYSIPVTSTTTRECTLYGVPALDPEDGSEPLYATLICRPAWDINTDYANARIKVSKPRSKTMQKQGVKAQDMRAIRLEDKPLYAEHVVVGWKNVFDGNQQEVPFTKEDCKEFLAAIPDQEFDEIREFCNNHVNWGLNPLDGDELAGNSSSDLSTS